ncbi:MAG: 30S ribosomal protein S17 [Candidatus Levybacteria bacterium]|nr:30S ribosomal protein S17 [Candidatus Levybacteria bacterium]
MARKQLTGTVASTKMTKTVVVSISRRIQHHLYKKFITVTKRIKADTNGFDLKEGDVVKIEQTSPISKDKTFKVIAKTEEGK